MEKEPLLKRLGIGSAIALVLTLLVHSGISLFLSQPYAEDYCTLSSAPIFEEIKDPTITRETSRWVQTRSGEEGYVRIDDSCYERFQQAQMTFEQNGYIAILLTFVVSMVIGVLIRSNRTISGGFVWGSLLILVSGVIRFWEGIDLLAKFLMLVISLAVLIWLGYKRVTDTDAPNKENA